MASTVAFILALAIGFSAYANAAGDKECVADSQGSCGDSSALLQASVLVDGATVTEEQKGNGITGWVSDWLWGPGWQRPKTPDPSGAVINNAMHGHNSLTPPKFLIISSTSQKKVVWTLVPDFPEKEGQTFDLITQGLEAPKALALDKQTGQLYVADSGAQKIFRYTLLLDKSRSQPHLASTHMRITIVENCGPVEWIHLDDDGNLFYSSARTQNINKVPTAVMKKLGSGELQASALTIVSQKILQAQEAKREKANATYYAEKSHLPTDPPPVLAHIHSIYEAKLNPNVEKPGALWVEGEDLYWTNQEGGLKAGTIVKGQVHPKVPNALLANATAKPAPFPATPLSKASSGAIALCKAKEIIFFTRNETIRGTSVEVAGDAMMVSGFVPGSGLLIDYVRGLGGARQLLWDKGQTMFVADDVMGAVTTFPTGRIMADVPTVRVASVPGAFGLAITFTSDEWFKANSVDSVDDIHVHFHNQ